MLWLKPSSVADNTSFKNIVYLHRAQNHLAKEKLQKICRYKQSGLEVDILFTKDEVPILFHDLTFEEFGHKDKQVEALTLSEVKKILPQEYFITLEAFIEKIDSCPLKVEFDIKSGKRAKMQAEKLAAVFNKSNLYQRAHISSFYPNLLYYVTKSDNKIVTAFSIHNQPFDNHWLDPLLTWISINFTAFWLDVKLVQPIKHLASQDLATFYNKHGIYLNIWTVNAPSFKAFINDILGESYTTNCFTVHKHCADNANDETPEVSL